jgi:death on curing protein
MRHYRVTLRDVIAAHDEALSYGGRTGILDINLIESAIGRPYSGYHRRISQKAAALLESLSRNHGFVDGNKRTALLVSLLMINRSGFDLQLTDNEQIDDIVVDVADGHMQFETLAGWFRERVIKIA